VGPGCDNCYARELDKRHKWGGAVHWGAGVPRYRTSEHAWKQPLKWNEKAKAGGLTWRVFCASLADVFDNEVPKKWREDLWELIWTTRNLSWLLVTKRVGNVAGMMPPEWIKYGFPDNVRLLITVCNQEEADRDIPKLLALPCKNGVSYEPALGPIDWSRIKVPSDGSLELCAGGKHSRRIEWIIVGGESTQGAGKARPFDLAWARSTVAQCKDAGVPVFVKQLGSSSVWSHYPPQPSVPIRGHRILSGPVLKHRAGADPAEWPSDLKVQEFPE
jgi:protein gp37